MYINKYFVLFLKSLIAFTIDSLATLNSKKYQNTKIPSSYCLNKTLLKWLKHIKYTQGFKKTNKLFCKTFRKN